jgi:prevent-host-death family protein
MSERDKRREKRPMVHTMPATQARVHFGEVLKRVHRGGEHVIVEKDGLEIAAILSRADYEDYRRMLALRQLEELNKAINREMQRKGITEEQALAELEKTQQAVFEEQYGRALKSRRHKAA